MRKAIVLGLACCAAIGLAVGVGSRAAQAQAKPQEKPATLKVETAGENGSYHIRVTSPVLARSVYLSFGHLNVKVADNYFDLIPGETVEIIATSSATLNELRTQLKVISLRDAFEPSGQSPVARVQPESPGQLH